MKAHGKALKIAAERGIDNNIDDASVVNTHSDTDRPRQAWERICNMDRHLAAAKFPVRPKFFGYETGIGGNFGVYEYYDCTRYL